MKKISALLLISCLVFCFAVFAQEQNDIDFNNLVHIGTEQGLSSNKVNCIFQDKKGFIWIGTDYGLNRYDGYSFKLFIRNEEDSNSLTDNNINCITQDAIGNLWIGTPKGLNVMNYKTEKIQRYTSTNKKDALWEYNITALAADDSSVWIGTAFRGLLQYKIYKKELIKYTKPHNDDSLRKSIINNLVIENNGNVLAGISDNVYVNGLLELNISNRRFNQTSLDKKLLKQNSHYTKYSSNNAIESIFKAENGDIYISTLGGGATIDPTCDSCKTYIEYRWEGKLFFKKNNDISFKEITLIGFEKNNPSPLKKASFVEYETNKFLCFNHNYCILFKLKNYEPALSQIKKINYPNNINLEKVIKDNTGKLWFITSNGIETLNPQNFKCNFYRNTESLSPTSIIEDSKKRIWIGSNDVGLVLFNPVNRKFKSFKPKKNTKFSFDISGSFNRSVAYGIGNYQDVYSFDEKINELKKVIDLKKFIDTLYRNYEWNELICTSDNGLWANIYGRGIAKVNIDNQSVSFVVPSDSLNEHSSNCFPYIDDGDKNFYYANRSKIIQVNYKNNKYRVCNIQTKGLNIRSNYVSNLALDSNNNLWLATTKTGLFSFNILTQKFNHYQVKDGLPSNETNRILFVNGVIWVCYSTGIYKFNPSTNSNDKSNKLIIKNYTLKDGLPGFINYGINAMAQCYDEKILLTIGNLVISFYPDSIKSNQYISPVVITSLQVNNKTINAGDSDKILINSITSTDTIHLKHNQNNLSFEFAALNYIHPELNEYAYKLEGLDTGWIYSDKRRFVNYSNLKPGTYTLKIKASNNDGLWNEKGTQLIIMIAVPWWQTWWAYLLYSIVLLIISICIIRLFTLSARRKQKRAELLQKVSATEMKALRSQMNPHFIFNALQSIQTFLLSHQSEEANTYLLKFSKLMRAVLENSQYSEVPLKDDIQALELYMQLESIRLQHPFTYNFHIDKSVDTENDTIPPLILQPFVENAIWHGLQYKPEPGHINIYLSKKDNALHAIVEDNGVGRNMSKQVAQPMLIKKESLGMKLTEERLKVLNEVKKTKAQFTITDLFSKNNIASGTKVELLLPLAI